MISFFFNIKIKTYQIDLGQLGLKYQIHDPGYKTMITLQKANQNKLLSLIFYKFNIELNEKNKKNSIKKHKIFQPITPKSTFKQPNHKTAPEKLNQKSRKLYQMMA